MVENALDDSHLSATVEDFTWAPELSIDILSQLSLETGPVRSDRIGRPRPAFGESRTGWPDTPLILVSQRLVYASLFGLRSFVETPPLAYVSANLNTRRAPSGTRTLVRPDGYCTHRRESMLDKEFLTPTDLEAAGIAKRATLATWRSTPATRANGSNARFT